MQFIPKHFSAEGWTSRQEDGYQLRCFLPTEAAGQQLDAEQFLRSGLQLFFDSEQLSESYLLLAKIVGYQKPTICLRVDRDYVSVYQVDDIGRKTLATWQFASKLRGFRLDELWLNMLHLASA